MVLGGNLISKNQPHEHARVEVQVLRMEALD